ncbi:hypothetical protein ACTWP5_08005 [Streptomyces sp. 4N509B]|uniref:hypothetical protein n=1 Tax=Streptomyces sp. 4N509B TaxID=3457413 RepID=UPI003FD13DBE
MQTPAGPGLPHTQTRPVHWAVTAAVLAAACGAAALIQPADATATPEPAAPATDAPSADAPVVEAPSASAASFPLDCGPYDVLVTAEESADIDGDGRPETVAAVRCDAAGGTPPSGLYVLAAAEERGGAPRVAETLLDPAEQMTVELLEASSGTITARLLGYSSPDVPRAQPDLHAAVTWTWRDGRLHRDAEVPVTAHTV